MSENNKDIKNLPTLKLGVIPIRMEVDLSFVPPKTRDQQNLVNAEERMRIDASRTKRLMNDLSSSVVRATQKSTSQVQFGGVMKHKELGQVQVRGRSEERRGEVRLSGQFEFSDLKPGSRYAHQVQFLVEEMKVGEKGVNDVMQLYEKLIKNKNQQEIAVINKDFGEIFRVLAKQYEDDGKPVMYVTDRNSNMDVRPQVSQLELDSKYNRLVGKAAFALDFVRGSRIDETGKMTSRKEQIGTRLLEKKPPLLRD